MIRRIWCFTVFSVTLSMLGGFLFLLSLRYPLMVAILSNRSPICSFRWNLSPMFYLLWTCYLLRWRRRRRNHRRRRWFRRRGSIIEVWGKGHGASSLPRFVTRLRTAQEFGSGLSRRLRTPRWLTTEPLTGCAAHAPYSISLSGSIRANPTRSGWHRSGHRPNRLHRSRAVRRSGRGKLRALRLRYRLRLKLGWEWKVGWKGCKWHNKWHCLHVAGKCWSANSDKVEEALWCELLRDFVNYYMMIIMMMMSIWVSLWDVLQLQFAISILGCSHNFEICEGKIKYSKRKL